MSSWWLRKPGIVAIGMSILFLSLAYCLDQVYSGFPGDANCIATFWSCWLVRNLLTGLFAISAVVYVRLLAGMRLMRVSVLLVVVILALIPLAYPVAHGLIPFLTYGSLRAISPLARLHLGLSATGPRSYLAIASFLVMLAALLCSWRPTKSEAMGKRQ